MRFDSETFAVIMAVIVVASVFSVAQAIPRRRVPFDAIALLGPDCRFGDYPRFVVAGEPVTLCVFVANYLGRPAYMQVRVKLGSREALPTNTTPLNAPALLVLEGVLNDGGNFSRRVKLVLNETGVNIALVFELWRYDSERREWVYDGKWAHLYVNVTRVIP